MDSSVPLRTLFLVNLACILERADEALLPAVYNEIGVGLHAEPLSLGTLTFFRAIVQALSSPLAAYLSFRHDRASIIAFGAVWWGLATLFVGMSSSYWAVAAACAADGVGLAIVVPAIRSMVADLHVEDHRGSGFGWLHASGQAGTILGGIFATLMAARSFLGLPGWRSAFVLMAIISFLLAIGLYLFAKDPRPDALPLVKKPYDTSDDLDPPLDPAWEELTAGVLQVVHIRTFQVIVAQGVVGQIPWMAMLFFTLWLELLGFSHGRAASLVALLSVGNMIGSVFGGFLGDWAAMQHPSAGRILCAQFGAGVGIPLSAILLAAVPDTQDWAPVFGLIFFAMGFCLAWNAPACNWPILSEIVPSRLRTLVFALSLALEKGVAALGAPLVALLAQKLYGFKFGSPNLAAGGPTTERDLDHAQSLAKGIFLAIGVPVSMCVVLITGLYWTYPGDRGKARIQSWVDNAADVVERGEIELERQWVESRKGEGNFDDDWWSESNRSSSSEGSPSKSPPREALWEENGCKMGDGGEVDDFEGAGGKERLLGGNNRALRWQKKPTSR